MAITRNRQFIRLTAAADVVSDTLQVQALHVVGASLEVTDKDGVVLLKKGTGTEEVDISFPCKIEFNGISFVGTGEVTVFLS